MTFRSLGLHRDFHSVCRAIVASLRFCRPKMIANSLRTSIRHKHAFISCSILTQQKGNVLEP